MRASLSAFALLLAACSSSAPGPAETTGSCSATLTRCSTLLLHRIQPTVAGRCGGVLHTSGGLVFQGTASGELEALDAKTGALLWSRPIGGSVRAAPSTVMAGGEQLLLIASGSGSSAVTSSWVSRYANTGRRQTPARLLAFRLGGTAPLPESGARVEVPKPREPRMEKGLVARGRVLFEAYECIACHGHYGDAVHGAIPNLLTTPPPSFEVFRTIVQGGALAVRGMPQFPFSDEEAKAVYAFVVESGWQAWETQRDARETRPP